jgi:hypothetical protein
MKWRIVANGAALVVTISIGATIAGGSPARTYASGMSRVGGGTAIGLLQNIRVENERGAGYVRALFEHWRDIDGDGCDAREQVLKRDSVTLPQVDPYKCKVIAGDWVSPYDGARWSDPTDIDIDHVVALKEAWDWRMGMVGCHAKGVCQRHNRPPHIVGRNRQCEPTKE